MIEQSVVSRIVAQLESSGLAQRRKRVGNSRLVDVRLTPRGEETYAALFPYARRIVEDAVGALSPKERETLEALLSRMFEYVTQPYEPWKKLADERSGGR